MRHVNVELRQQLAQERQQNPAASLQEIGDKFGLSRERVRQLLKELNQPTRAVILSPAAPVKCDHCGKVKDIAQWKVRYLLANGQRHFFCDRQCLGSYLAAHHGFPVHPENIYDGPAEDVAHPRKYRPTIYVEMRSLFQQGLTEREIAALLGVPRGTVSWELYRKSGKPAPVTGQTQAVPRPRRRSARGK